MKEAFLAVVVIEMAVLNATATPSLADELPPLNSQWRETQRGSCFEISQISDPFPGSADCVQIAGRMNERDLMIGYYRNLTTGKGRGDSLRQAQLQMLKSKSHSHPYYWASFIQTGEWANLEGKR